MTLYRATFFGSYLGVTIKNVVHFQSRVAQGAPPPSTQLLAEDLGANWLVAERVFHQNSFRWTSVNVSEIRNPNPMAAHVHPVNVVGSGITQSHTVSCIKFRWLTNRGGRRGFGKYYMGGINWALIGDQNSLSQTTQDNLTGFLAGIEGRYMQDDIGNIPFAMVLVHKDVNDPPNLITGAQFYAVLGSQRRRTKFVGE